MSRKDYRKFAEMIDRMLAERGQLVPMDKVAQKIADIFKEDNPRFRYDRFFAACGLNEWGEPK